MLSAFKSMTVQLFNLIQIMKINKLNKPPVEMIQFAITKFD